MDKSYSAYCQGRKEGAKAFLSAIDDKHPSVNFTMELTERRKLPFQRLEIVKQMSRLETKVYKEPKYTGLLHSVISQVDERHKKSLLKIMLNHDFNP